MTAISRGQLSLGHRSCLRHCLRHTHEMRERTNCRRGCSFSFFSFMEYYTGKGRNGQDKKKKTCRETQHVKIDMERDASIIICRMVAVGENYNSTRDIYSTEFEQRTPMMMQIFVAFDNAIYNSPAAAEFEEELGDGLMKLYLILAKGLIESNDRTTDDMDENEEKDLKLYLSMLQNYIDENTERHHTDIITGYEKKQNSRESGGVIAPKKNQKSSGSVKAPRKKM